ncbi:ABC transporter permease subunit [Nocardiopsis alba]|uniref:ABC transporter permease subunit n=1 Tax=Nocardiopsis alba TaxID=53437 RepID=A0A7K2J0U2_9ACTN|nr:ABC transporter permease subunit [Nocardiopsis alba]MYR35674.1 ABC transporter permease subunit [Nocardiopsis alba]
MTRFVSRATCAFVLIPILATLVAATSVDFSQGPWGGGVTLDWFAYAWPPLAPVIGRSLAVAAIVVALNLLLGGPLAWWVARHPSPLTRLTGYLVNVPLAVPGIALSVALVGTYPMLRPSGLLLVMGHLVFTLPFTLAALTPALADTELRTNESVARSLGAGPLRVLRTITVPACLVAVTQAVTMVFALSFGEFNVSFFINPPATSTAPFALFDSYSTQRLESASAQSAIFIAFVVPVLTAVILARRRAPRRTP